MSLSEGIYNVFPKSWEEYVEIHGPRYEKVTGRDREDLYNNAYQRQKYERELERRDNQATAAKLTKGFGVQNTIAAASNELAGIASLVGVIDGPGGITMEGVYEALRTPYQYNKEAIEQAGIALTEDGDRVVQDFIEQNALTSVAGQAAVIVPELIIGFNQVPDLARQVSRLIKKRQTGQALTAAENAELLNGIKQLDEFKLAGSIDATRPTKIDVPTDPNVGFMSKTDEFRGFKKYQGSDFTGKKVAKTIRKDQQGKYVVGQRETGENVLANKEQIKEVQKMFKDGAFLKDIQKKTGLGEIAVQKIIGGAGKGDAAMRAARKKEAMSFIGTKEKNLIEKIKRGEVYNLVESNKKNIIEKYDNIENLPKDDFISLLNSIRQAIQMDKKAKGLYSTPNFMKLLEDNGIKTYRGMFDPKYALGSELNKALKITKLTRDPVKGGGQGGTFLFFKPPTKLQLEKIKKIIDADRAPTIRPEIAQRVLNFLDNPTVLSYLNKSKLPPLEVMMKQFPGLTDSQIAASMVQLINRLDNAKPFRIPDRGGALTQEFSKIRKNSKRSQKLIDQMQITKEGFNAYKRAHYKLMADKMDKALNRTSSHITSLRPNGQKVLSKYGVVADIHEPASVTAAARADIPSFANFVVVQTPDLNRKILRQTQGQLSRRLQAIIENPKSFKKEMDAYNASMRKLIKENPKLEGQLVFIREADDVKNQFTPERLDELRDKYGMNLVAEAKAAGFSLEIPKNAIPIEELISETPEAIEMINRFKQGFEEGGRVTDEIQDRRDAGREYDNGRFVVSDLQELDSVKALQQQIKQMYESEIVTGVRDATEKKFEEIQEDAKRNLRTERPVKFKASELPNVAREFVFKPVGALMTAPAVGALNSIEATYNFLRQGEENDVDMKQKFPNTYKLFDYYTSGIGATPEDQTYIGFIDESIRAVQKGSQNLGYGILDLAYSVPDFAFETDLQERLQAEYDKHAFADPETFLGNAGAIMVEFGVPSTTMFKFLNFVRKGIKARTGVNLAATSTYGMKGAEKAKTAISNVAKRVGIVAPSAFAGEFVGGSRYNTLTRMDPEDPLFLDEALGYNYIDTTGLSGKERTIADLKNRVRFGTEGALVAGMFPLLGPALAKVTKNGVIKPSAYIAGKGLQAANFLAIKPVSYLLARTPGVAQAGQLGAQALGVGASFLGKDILARAALGVMGTPTAKQLPDFKDWRMFSVTSSDPLERNIKRFDNFLAYFRDTANQTADRFFITGQTSRKIKATSRKIEKQLDIIEKRAYDLARGFLKDYNTGTTSPAKQQYYLDQVLAYMRGQVKAADLPDMLKEPAEALNKTFMEIKRDFADVLPEKSGMREFLESNLRQYMRASFASFTNPLYKPDKQVFNKAVDFMVDRINRNESMVEAAVRQSNQPTDVAIRDFAKRSVESILERGKSEGKDPIDALNYIARTNLKLDDLVIQTGEELPKAIRELLGEEKSLRASVMTTASDLASQTANVQMYDRLADLGLKERWLYTSADEAVAAGIADPKKIGPRLPGLGKLNSPISNLYGGKEVVESIVNTAGPLDTLLKNGLYQNLIAYKAMVQTGKTVFSPATQTRNFGSAGFFPLQSGHIGGSASVTDAFKIILDDVFGAGKVADEQQLIDRITRKVELGVLDENVVVSELKDILQDVKRGNLKTLSKFSERVDNTKLSDVATRLYAGGDNVWKWYGHEFVMSQIKNGFKNVDDVAEQYKRTFGPTINPKNLQEGIEQYAATLIRETYPTYSKVPKLIQTIRRIPFIGNFVSFPAEILRTTFATTGYAMKHIASDNPTLRELGYRTLMGQFLTYGGIGAGTTYLGQAMTNVTTEQINDIKQYFVPEFMRFSDLVPMTNIEDGVVKVFDNSRYFPYDLITSTVGNAINRASRPGEKLDPDQIETDMFKDIYNYTGPFADLAGGTLFGVSIGYEPALDFLRGGKTKTGSAIYSKSDTTLEKFDKMFAHTFETINPGFVRTLTNLYRGAAGLLTGTGQPIKMTDEVFKLFGGSTVTIDIPGSFRYQIGELKSSFREPKVAEGFFRPDFRTGAQLVREYNEQNEEAFREQYEFFKIVRAARRNKFISDGDIIKLLVDRVGKRTAVNIINGRFTPLSYSEEALRGRYENVKRGNPKMKIDITEYLPFGKLTDVKVKWMQMTFEDYERELKEPEQRQQTSQVTQPAPAAEQEPQTPELAETPAAIPGPPPVASVPNPATGLTPVESSLLSREEQLIRQRQRGLA